jgi:hypothetical protein
MDSAPVFLSEKGLVAPVHRLSIGGLSGVHREIVAALSHRSRCRRPIVVRHSEGLVMDVIGQLANALVGLSAILGIARWWYVAALVVADAAPSRWMNVIVMTVACVALVSSGARAQTRVDEVTLQATAPVEETLVVRALRTDREAQAGESELPGSAIYSPFSAGAAIAKQEHPAVASKASSAPEPGLTMTLAASAGGAIALAWLLYRI